VSANCSGVRQSPTCWPFAAHFHFQQCGYGEASQAQLFGLYNRVRSSRAGRAMTGQPAYGRDSGASKRGYRTSIRPATGTVPAAIGPERPGNRPAFALPVGWQAIFGVKIKPPEHMVAEDSQQHLLHPLGVGRLRTRNSAFSRSASFQSWGPAGLRQLRCRLTVSAGRLSGSRWSIRRRSDAEQAARISRRKCCRRFMYRTSHVADAIG